MDVIVRVRNPQVIEALANPDIYRPAVTRTIEKIVKRMERGGKGLGARNNTVLSEPRTLGAEVRTTLNPPRTRGVAWHRYNIAAGRAMATRVLNSETKKEVEAAWSASG